MTTYSNLKYDHSFSSNATGTGGLTKISSQTASSSSSLSFTTGIDSSYKEYVFKFINIHPATDFSSLQFNFSIDGGSNYNVTKTTTGFQSAHNESDSATPFEYLTGIDLAQSTSYQSLNENSGNDNDQAISGYMHLFEPSSTTFVKHYISQMHTANGGEYATNIFTAGYGNTTSAINAIDFKMSSGNIDNGTIIMYGVS
jgi:hypothetical protein